MKIKYMKVTMPDKSVWMVEASIVANNRADYYAKNDPDAYGDALKTFRAEYKYTMEDHDELIDWARNNMDWCEFEDDAVRVDIPSAVDYGREWSDAECEVVETDVGEDDE